MTVAPTTETATLKDVGGGLRVTRWVATIAGLIGFVLSVAAPLLPVVQTTATLNWPQQGQFKNVTAPMISLTPVAVTVTVPCSVVAAMPPEGGLLLGTAPKQSKDAALNGLSVNVTGKRVDVSDRNVVLAGVPRSQAASPACQHIEVTSTGAGTFATFVGLPGEAGQAKHNGFPDPNLRPQIVGVFTDLTGPAPPGLRLSATIDTRFSTRPTALKLAAILLAITATVVSLVALWRLDQLDGRRMRRLVPRRWRGFGLADATVIFLFLA
jgi:arabinosyltransferase B